MQIFVESWAENDFSLPRYDTFEDLLQHLLWREQKRWLSLLDGDQPCCNSLIRLLLRANISGRLDIKALPDLYRPDWEKVDSFLSSHSFPGKQRQEAAQSLISSVCQNMDQKDAAANPKGHPHSQDMDMLAALKVSGLHLVARQYGGWSVYDVSQMMAVIGDMLAVPGEKGTEFLKQLVLQEHIKELSLAGFAKEALYLKGKMDCLIKENPEDSWNALLKMQNGNAAMMNYLLAGDFWQAASVFKKMASECSYQNTKAAECLAHSCFNIEHFAFLMQKEKYRGAGLEAAQKLSVLLPENQKVRLRLLGCQAVELQWQYFPSHSLSHEALLEKLDRIEKELAAVPLGDPDLNEAFDMSWGIAKTLKINAIQENGGKLGNLIDEAYHILSQYPELTCVLTTCITAVHAMHKNVLKDKVPHDETEKLFRYVELNYHSESAREAFFTLLNDSEDAGRRGDYITKPVALGARQDARYGPLGSGLEEFDKEADFLKMLSGYVPTGTFRREQPKIGANAPCPCGSGKNSRNAAGGKVNMTEWSSHLVFTPLKALRRSPFLPSPGRPSVLFGRPRRKPPAYQPPTHFLSAHFPPARP